MERSKSPVTTDQAKKRTKSPLTVKEVDSKKVKLENDEVESPEDIARQYKKFQSSAKYDLNSEELFCVCRKPDHGGELMISCDGCEEWFHAKCMRIDSRYIPLIEKFFCKFCHWRDGKTTRWSRKCRLPDCMNPIDKAIESKYCSEACGLAFLESKLNSRDSIVSQGEMKFVFDFCDSYETFKNLGKQFPELPEVTNLDYNIIPGEIKKKLTDIDEMREQIEAEIGVTDKKVLYHQATKEKIKMINEKIQQAQSPSEVDPEKSTKKKKSSSKKVDLCCYQPELDEILSEPGRDKNNCLSLGFHKLLENPAIISDTSTLFKDEINNCVNAFHEDSNYSAFVYLTGGNA